MKKIALNFDYPLKYSYFIENEDLSELKKKVDIIKKYLLSQNFESVQIPFLTSRDTVKAVTNDYNVKNLIQVYPAGNKKKPLLFSPYMLFLQALPLIKAGRFSYKDYPLKWFFVGPGYKGIIKSVSDPYNQTEEIYCFQGAVFFVNDRITEIEMYLANVLEKVCELSIKNFTKDTEKLFYKKDSTVFKDREGDFLAGYHTIQIENLRKTGIQIKNRKNKDMNLFMSSFSISQNCLL